MRLVREPPDGGWRQHALGLAATPRNRHSRQRPPAVCRQTRFSALRLPRNTRVSHGCCGEFGKLPPRTPKQSDHRNTKLDAGHPPILKQLPRKRAAKLEPRTISAKLFENRRAASQGDVGIFKQLQRFRATARGACTFSGKLFEDLHVENNWWQVQEGMHELMAGSRRYACITGVFAFLTCSILLARQVDVGRHGYSKPMTCNNTRRLLFKLS